MRDEVQSHMLFRETKGRIRAGQLIHPELPPCYLSPVAQL